MERVCSFALAVHAALAALALPLSGQQRSRPEIDALEFAPLRFEPTEPGHYEVGPGVHVFFFEDHDLPLISIHARFEGGPSHFDREWLGAATAVPSLLRSGGTVRFAPDSVDRLLEFYAAETTFGGGGRTAFSSVNTLTRYFDEVLDVWGDLLKNPRFDQNSVEVWRGRELEDVRRRKDSPGRLAIGKFNQLLFGDHPVGWQMGREDLEPAAMARERLKTVHGRIFCPENLTLGVTGDVTWKDMAPKLEQWLAGWPACTEPLPDAPLPIVYAEPGVYLVPRELEQSTVVIGKPSAVRLADDADYFASRIGNSILGASGLTSRLVSRVRTQEGLAYSASSIWTTPVRSTGIVGAITQTKSESTVAAIRVILDVMDGMSETPLPDHEIQDAIARSVNGFVFNFQNPGQIVSRQMVYLSQDLPLDWLTRYMDGIQNVTPAGIQRVFQENLDTDQMVILIVGDPSAFDAGLEELGPIRTLEVEEIGAGSSPGNAELRGPDPEGC